MGAQGRKNMLKLTSLFILQNHLFPLNHCKNNNIQLVITSQQSTFQNISKSGLETLTKL